MITGKSRSALQLATDLRLTKKQVQACIAWLKTEDKVHIGSRSTVNRRHSPVYHAGPGPDVPCPAISRENYHKNWQQAVKERERKAEIESKRMFVRMIVLPREFFGSAA
jgi:hypothetical protein